MLINKKKKGQMRREENDISGMHGGEKKREERDFRR
jgi:hypothetical protein